MTKLLPLTALLLMLILAQIGANRLSDSVKPLKYEVIIQPNFTENTFEGEVKILLTARRANTRTIVLNIAGLEIDQDWRITRPDLPGFQPPHGIATENVEEQTFSMPFNNPLELDREYVLILPYTGKINAADAGFFQSQVKEDGEKVYSTHSAPIFSRLFLPCFDEPGFKAEFQLTVKDVGSYSVISNGLQAEKIEHDG